jgi:hypothetical protein
MGTGSKSMHAHVLHQLKDIARFRPDLKPLTRPAQAS